MDSFALLFEELMIQESVCFEKGYKFHYRTESRVLYHTTSTTLSDRGSHRMSSAAISFHLEIKEKRLVLWEIINIGWMLKPFTYCGNHTESFDILDVGEEMQPYLIRNERRNIRILLCGHSHSRQAYCNEYQMRRNS